MAAARRGVPAPGPAGPRAGEPRREEPRARRGRPAGSPVEIPVDGRPLRLAMGTRPLDLHDWIRADENAVDELALKAGLLAQRPGDVLAATPEGAAGAAETLELLAAHLPARFPGRYALQEGGGRAGGGWDRVLVDRLTGFAAPLTGAAAERPGVGAPDPAPAGSPPAGWPLAVAARLVQEDLCVLTGDDLRLTAACVCFPSRWRLADKIGLPLSEVHDPVPGYADRLDAPVTTVLRRLDPDRPLWRLNWTLLDTAELFAPDPPAAPDRPAGPASLTFRVERQTLRRLPRTGGVLFTIRTTVRPLAALGDERPGVYADLAASLRGAAPELVAYKGLAGVLPALLGWLEARSVLR